MSLEAMHITLRNIFRYDFHRCGNQVVHRRKLFFIYGLTGGVSGHITYLGRLTVLISVFMLKYSIGRRETGGYYPS